METTEKAVARTATPSSSGRLHLGLDRLRRHRLTIRIGVTLEYSERGQTVSVPAYTVWVSDREALVVAQESVPEGRSGELKIAFTGDRQGFRLSSVPAKHADGYCALLQFDSPVAGFWHIVFPQPRA